MATRVRIFISAAPDEDPARGLLGRALAELPVNIGWVIKRTPDVDSVAECHLYALVLGTDIWAPVGLELWWARRTEKPILAYAADAADTRPNASRPGFPPGARIPRLEAIYGLAGAAPALLAGYLPFPAASF